MEPTKEDFKYFSSKSPIQYILSPLPYSQDGTGATPFLSVGGKWSPGIMKDLVDTDTELRNINTVASGCGQVRYTKK